PKVPRLTIAVTELVPGLVVARDGAPLAQSDLGIAMKVDPGTIVIAASAPGRREWSDRVDLPAGEARVVRVPALGIGEGPRREVVAPPPPPPSRAPPTGLTTQRTIALAIAGAGVISIGFGTYFGLKSNSEWADSQSHCKPGDADHVTCDGPGNDL